MGKEGEFIINMKLIVGLGNPGRGYARNRHNIGFMCVSHFARVHGIKFDKKQCNARTGTGKLNGEEVILARPQTWMNFSGESVDLLVRKFAVNLNDLIVIHDDLDLPLGKIRLRCGGSSGGHKGINSIIKHLGGRDFCRIKVGIDRPDTTDCSAREKEADIINYVLADFTAEEGKIISSAIPEVSQAICCLLSEDLTAAMNKYN